MKIYIKPLLLAGLVMGHAAFAQPALTPAQFSAQQQTYQASGTALANTLMTGASTSPASLTGTSNAMGSQTLTAAPSSLTDLQQSGSLISIGNTAKNNSISTFQQYTPDRTDQYNQANYFVAKNPILIPALSPTDPMALAATSSISTPPIRAQQVPSRAVKSPRRTLSPSQLITLAQNPIFPIRFLA